MTTTRTAFQLEVAVSRWFDNEDEARTIGEAIDKLVSGRQGQGYAYINRLEVGAGINKSTRIELNAPKSDVSQAIYNHQTIDGETRTIINEVEKIAKNVEHTGDVAPADEFWADFREKCLNPDADSVTGRRVCAVDYRMLAEKTAERLQQTPEETAETLRTVLGNIAAAAAVREFSTATAVRKVRK